MTNARNTQSTAAALASAALSPRRRTLALWLVAGGMFMAVLDATIVNVALPAMQANLRATAGGLAWIVDAYTLSMAALILAGGVLADRWGARRVYLLGLALFTVASALCGAAGSVVPLVAARFLQGLGAALFLPASLAIVRSIFDEPGQRARAIATWAGIASLAAAVGPVLGGLLVGGLGWRSVFFVNLPAGLLALGLTAWAVPLQPGQAARPFDWAGQLTSIALLGAVCFAAIELPQQGVASPAVWLAALIAVTAGLLWVRAERRACSPMVPLAWFGNPVFVAANAVGCLVYVGYFGMLFVLSLYLHADYGLDARQTGLALLPVAASLSFGNVVAASLTGRIAPSRLIGGSLALAALSAPISAALLTTRAPWPATGTALIVFGLGTAASVPPTIAAVLEQVPESASGVASGLLNALRQFGSLLGVAAASAAITLSARPSGAMWVVAMMAAVAYALGTGLALGGLDSQGQRIEHAGP